MATEDEEELGFHPDVIPDDGSNGTGLFCFMDASRACGPDCMAYTTHPRTSKVTELSEQQAHCALLLNTDRVGRNVTILASMAAERKKKHAIEKADEARNASSQPQPNPFQQSPFKGSKT